MTVAELINHNHWGTTMTCCDDERIADVKPGQVFSFPESTMPAARFVRIGDDLAVITQDGGLIGYPEHQFALYDGPVRVHEEDWPTAHAIRMEPSTSFGNAPADAYDEMVSELGKLGGL